MNAKLWKRELVIICGHGKEYAKLPLIHSMVHNATVHHRAEKYWPFIGLLLASFLVQRRKQNQLFFYIKRSTFFRTIQCAHLSKHPSDLKQNKSHERGNFLNQLFMAFNVCCKCYWSILEQPITSFYSMVFKANTCNKTEHSASVRKWCLFLYFV